MDELNVSNRYIHTSGQSLIEILFAIALFTIGVVTIGYLILESQTSLRNSMEVTEASYLAYEGIEAVRSLRDAAFGNLATGTHGLLLEEGRFTLASTSDTTGIYTRTLTIEDIDLETKEVTSEVSWNTTEVRAQSVAITEYLTDWMQTSGDAGSLSLDISAAALTASGTELVGISAENTSSTSITLSGMTLSWNGGEALYQITLAGTTIFSVATSSGLTSGTYANTDDYVFSAGAERTFNPIAFTGSVAGTDFQATFIMTDGSRKHALISP